MNEELRDGLQTNATDAKYPCRKWRQPASRARHASL